MLKARKRNRVVRIPDEKANEYKSLGYSLYNESGEAVYEHVVPAERIRALEEENALLKQENQRLKDELGMLKARTSGDGNKEEAGKGLQKAPRKQLTK